jgi:HK97 family phage prohead protease
MSIERRFTPGKVEVRAADGGAPSRICGYAAVFNSPSNLLRSRQGDFIEVIEPGAFDDVMQDDVRALFNHDANFVLARSKNGTGTLTLAVDETGLRYEFEAPNTSYAADLLESIKRGDIDASSFAFELKPNGDAWEKRDGVLTRTIKRGGISRLYDVSPVTYPAYGDTEASVRSLEDFLKAQDAPEVKSTPIRDSWAAWFGVTHTPSPDIK